MSAKELAEARRAKILARGTSRMKIVSGEAAPSTLSETPATPASPAAAPVASAATTPTESKLAAESATLADVKEAAAEALKSPEATAPGNASPAPDTPSSSSSTVTGTVDPAPGEEEASSPISKSSRPLAARRSKIEKALAAAAEEATAAAEDDLLEAASSEVFETELPTKKKATSPSPVASASKPKPKPKSIKEIEEEVARATAAFDAKQLNGDDADAAKDKGKAEDKEASDAGKTGDAADSAKNESASGASKEEKTAVVKAPTAPVVLPKPRAAPMSLPAVMRIVRLILLLLLGFGTGYRTFLSPQFSAATAYHERSIARLKASGGPVGARTMGELLGLSYNSAQEVSEEEEIAEWIRLSEEEDRAKFERLRLLHGSGTAGTAGAAAAGSGSVVDAEPERTWTEWGMQRALDHVDCSISAVGVVWWVASMVTPVVDSMLGISKRLSAGGKAAGDGGKFNLMDFVMNLRPRIQNYVFCYFGEVCVHMLAVVLALLLLPAIYSDNGQGSGGLGGGASISLMDTPTENGFAREF